MFRYHRILYRRLLRGQSNHELTRLRDESSSFPTLAQLIEDELGRRSRESSSRKSGSTLTALPFVARATAWPMS